jgi:DNA-binding NtrC family response regulator
MSLARVLVVDDEPSYRAAVSRYLTNNSYQVSAAESAERAVELLMSNRFDLVITDLKMHSMSGLDLIDKMKEIAPSAATIVMTAYATIDTAIEATRKGAFHYILKPFNVEDLFGLCQKAIENKRLKDENIYLKKQLNKNNVSPNIIAQSDAMKTVVKLIEKISSSDSSVLISGEEGVGKEFLAKSIHHSSHRSKNPFVKIDTGGISPEDLERELFGFVRGAFAGAVSSRPGKLEKANEGTLFLTDIAEVPLKVQVKLLNFLETNTFLPLGSNSPCTVDTRLIAATNNDVKELMDSGEFNSKLFQKLSVIPISIPPLRERKQDIPGLVNYFINHYSSKNAKLPLELSEEALQVLLTYPWPGNVGEVEALVEQLVVLNDTKISEACIPDTYKSTRPLVASELNKPNLVAPHRLLIPENGINLNQVVSSIEEDLIMQALDRTKWNKNRAAKLLRLNRTTLVEKLRKKGLINSKT